MPDWAVQGLLDICANAERSGRWPWSMLQALVTAIEKHEGASVVTEFRPICVLSLAYRTWASIRARQALAHLSAIAPASMFGHLARRSPGMLWYSLQAAVEASQLDGTVLSGAFLDLSKAFNLLPREPVFAMALKLGIPPALIHAWSGAVGGLVRRFRCQGAIGPALASCTGFAEGDPLSCVAMAVVDIALHRYMTRHCPNVDLSTFVDDWQTASASPTAVLTSLTKVEESAAAWDLALDPRKTVAWATSLAARRELRGSGLTVSHAARNLGGHMAFSRQCTNSTVTARVSSMTPLWPRLRTSCAPYHQKVRAVVTAAWPRALHAVSVVVLGACHYTALRAGAAQGLGMAKPGVNREVLLSLCEFPLADPEYYALRCAFRDARSFASWELLGPTVSSILHSGVRVSGPATALVAAVHSLGWSIDPNTGVLEDAISCFDLWNISPQELEFRLSTAWQSRVGVRVSGRPGFEGLERVDPGLTRRLQNGWDPQSRAALRIALSGGFYTQDALHHFGSDAEELPVCKWCGERDSQQHRLWHCPATKHIRDAPDLRLMPDNGLIPPAQALHAWALRPQKQFQLWRQLALEPDLSSIWEEPAPRAHFDLWHTPVKAGFLGGYGRSHQCG